MRAISGRQVVLWLLAASVVLLMAFGWILRRGRDLTELAQKRSEALPAAISSPHGPMRLVRAGRFLATTEQTPVELPAFYISEQPVARGLNFEAAQKFCGEAGMRLPRPLEWEKAMEQVPAVEEWVEDPHEPKKFELRVFRALRGDAALNPAATLDEKWSTIRGGPGRRRTDSTSAPLRFDSETLAFRCLSDPP